MDRAKVYQLINKERGRQAEKWNRPHLWGEGDCSSALPDIVKLAVMFEEAGEVARGILEQDKSSVRTELVHVAAVAVAWLESFDA